MPIRLAGKGAPGYCIVIAAGAARLTSYAAEELAEYINKICGAKLPVVRDNEAAAEFEIVVGAAGRPGVPGAGMLRNDGYVIKTDGSRLYIRGENPRGDLYGVYGFLEDILGCRFFTHEAEHIPKLDEITLSDIDRKVSPAFEYRSTSWHEISAHPAFAKKRGLNSGIGEEGGEIRYFGFAHTFFNYVSPKEYFDTHPEYFSMINGVRVREETQLCLSNPDVLEITKRKLRENIIAHPECKIFSLTQMDWYNPCQCPECARVDAEEGAHSGTLIRFVNACAASIADEFPDVLIDTFAYQYTRQAPKLVKPLPNVCVRICSIECCFTHPMRTCGEIVRPFKYIAEPGCTFQKDLTNWSKICKRIYVWDYTTNYRFYLAPMINLHVIQDNVNFFIENNVAGLFEQGNGQSKSGEFGELRAYLLTKLMWTPKGDLSAWMDEFLAGYYGAAGKPLRAYIDLLRNYVLEYGVHAGIYESPMDVIPNALIPKMDALWDEAEKLVQHDGRLLDRVKRSRLQVSFVKHHRRRPTDNDFATEGEKLIADIKAHGVTYVQEVFTSRMPQPEALEHSFSQIRNGKLPDTWQVFWMM